MTRIQQQSPTAGGSLFKLCVLRSIFSDNGVNTTEVIHPSFLFFSRGQHARKKETNGKQKKEEKKEQNVCIDPPKTGMEERGSYS